MTLKGISLFLLALWLGAAIFFSAVVAPAAFSVLRAYLVPGTSEIAGAIVSRALSVINIGGFCVALLLLIFTVLGKSRFERWAFLTQMGLLFVMGLMCALGQWVIAARMRALRAALSAPIDELAMEDPIRVAFGALHQYSVTVLLIAMVAALVGSILLTRSGPNH